LTEKPLAGRVALITGASRGIGAATSVALARLGAHVVLTARTQGGIEETDDAVRLEGGNSTLLPMDLKDADQIDAVGPTIMQRFGRLDILVHNAGALGRLTPVGHITPRDFADCLAVNFTASYRLIRTCGPVLAASDAGRAVFVTTHVASAPRAFWGAYASTKAGMEMLVRIWADEVEGSALRVNLFDPGRTATRMRATAYPGEDPSTLPTPASVAEHLVPLCLPTEQRHGVTVRAPKPT
jgi:NAD(P)-dependent dehydrogenase (short-subunit alcohol dehydrogenase family)